MSKEKFVCQYCGKEFLSSGISLHERQCDLNPNKIKSAKSYKICDKCGEEISTLAFSRHYKSCDGSGKRKIKENAYHLDHDDLFCKFCSKECKNKNSLAQHECRCKENPDAYDMSYIIDNTTGNIQLYNEKIKSGEITVWNKGLTKGTSQSIQKGVDTYHQHLKEGTIHLSSGRASTLEKEEERKRKLSDFAIQNNQFWRLKKKHIVEYNGFKFDSTYEVIVAKSLDDNNIVWQKPKSFKYIFNDKVHIYTADFYLPDYDIYLDPKNDFLIKNMNPGTGYKDVDKINAVQQQNQIKIVILDKDHLLFEQFKQLLK